jgi:four helix bundle protein
MPITDHTQLIAWQLANELRILVFRFTSRPPASRDFAACGQIREASRSVCSNLTEGYYRFGHKEFARYVNIAKASLGETQDHLQDALQSAYVSQTEFDEMWKLSKRCMDACNGLHRYLRSTPDFGARGP